MMARLQLWLAFAFLFFGLLLSLADKAREPQRVLVLAFLSIAALLGFYLCALAEKVLSSLNRHSKGSDMAQREVIIKDTHRGLRYRDGVLEGILEAGRYEVPVYGTSLFGRKPKIEIVLVDVRERDLTIKGQEILTSDKVAIRVSIIVQFRVTDPRAALHEVASYEDRLYSDVQLAARRSLASMTLEEILTNRNRLSEDISRDVIEAAAGYGVAILRADVKDLIFPGNLQEIMNRVLTAERLSQAQLIEARTKAQIQGIEASAKLETQQRDAEVTLAALRLRAQNEAEIGRIRIESEVQAIQEKAKSAQAYSEHPALMRLQELETLRELARTANARIYIGFDKHVNLNPVETEEESQPD